MIKPFKKLHSYFIHSDGYVFQIISGKDKVLPIELNKAGKPIIRIEKNSYGLIEEMVSHFISHYPANSKLSYEIQKDLKVPLDKIKFVIVQESYLSEDENLLVKTFLCNAKAASANSRSKEQITGLEVYLCLKYSGFKCTFCGVELQPRTWHLDHYQPLSKAGRNVFENLEASCSICNKMKGALYGQKFYKMCQKIVANFIYKDHIETGNIKDEKPIGYKKRFAPKLKI